MIFMTSINIIVALIQVSFILGLVAFLWAKRNEPNAIDQANNNVFVRLTLELERRDNRIDELENKASDLRREVNGLVGAIEQMKVKLQREVKTREHLEEEVNRQKTRIVILESENVLLKKRNSELANRLGTSPLGDIENE